MVKPGLRHKLTSSLAGQLALTTVAALVVLAALVWRSGSFSALWLTPDQQAQRLYNELRFAEAADLFEAPMNKGAALYDAGRYEEAAATFGRVSSSVGFYNRGNALMRGREYVTAIASYEQAVAEAPDWPEAQQNLALSRYVLAYIEDTREQQDTGKMEADDYKYDSTKKSGIDTLVDRETALEAMSAEKWMRTVDTATGDFLRTRFALESAQEPAP